MSDHRRFKTVRRKLIVTERVEFWWESVAYYWKQFISAIFSKPPTETSDYVEVRKGDPDYDSAPWGLIPDEHALRYKLEDGEWKQV